MRIGLGVLIRVTVTVWGLNQGTMAVKMMAQDCELASELVINKALSCFLHIFHLLTYDSAI